VSSVCPVGVADINLRRRLRLAIDIQRGKRPPTLSKHLLLYLEALYLEIWFQSRQASWLLLLIYPYYNAKFRALLLLICSMNMEEAFPEKCSSLVPTMQDFGPHLLAPSFTLTAKPVGMPVFSLTIQRVACETPLLTAWFIRFHVTPIILLAI
jgi:hypothetical protein